MIGLAIKAGKVAAGLEETLKRLRKHQIDVVLMAQDIGYSSKKQLIKDCNSSKVLLVSIGNSEDWMEKLRISNKVLGIMQSPLSAHIKKLLGSIDG